MGKAIYGGILLRMGAINYVVVRPDDFDYAKLLLDRHCAQEPGGAPDLHYFKVPLSLADRTADVPGSYAYAITSTALGLFSRSSMGVSIPLRDAQIPHLVLSGPTHGYERISSIGYVREAAANILELQPQSHQRVINACRRGARTIRRILARPEAA